MKTKHFAIRTFVFCMAAATAGLMIPSTSAGAGTNAAASSTSDPYIWLEEIDGSNAMKWVRAENEKTLAVLEKDPRFETLYSEALTISEAKDRIPSPEIVHGEVLNFWRDADHVRGIWRRTTLNSYQTDSPQWTTILDLDELAKSEKANWVWKGSSFNQRRKPAAWSACPMGAKMPPLSANLIFRPAGLLKTGFACRRPNRASPGKTATHCWSPAQ